MSTTATAVKQSDSVVATTAPVLSLRDLVVTVRIDDRDVPAVAGVSLDLYRGRTLGLVGESGCGKSLTALAIMRLLSEPHVRIASGEIQFDGKNLATATDPLLRTVRGRRIAMIFQEPGAALNPVLTIGDQVGEPLRIHEGLSRKAAEKKAIALLDRVGIPAAAERVRAYPHQLSGGMKQRAMIAMALACSPEILVADEPTTALDVTVQAQILELLAELRRDTGMALLLITHDLGVVAETCDDVAVMYAGRIVEQSSAADLFAHPRHPYTVGLLAALPHMEGARVSRLQEIPGTVPPLGRPAPGCPFSPRCPHAADDCRAAVPELLGDALHRFRCIHPQ